VRARAMVGAATMAAAIAGTAAAQTPPAETLARLDAAANLVESWPGTFLLTTRATISRTDGSSPELRVSTMRMAGAEGGPRVVEVVSATRDGKDVTAKAQADAAKAQSKADARRKARRDGKAAGDEDGASLDLPGADTAGKFAFTPLVVVGQDCGASFAPAREHAEEGGLTRGELHWSCTTLDPLWVRASPATNPKGISEMTLRFEFARSGGTLYVARTVTDGVGGMLFIKRRFHVETEIGELALPAPPGTSAP
jgi:hypothetical protein